MVLDGDLTSMRDYWILAYATYACFVWMRDMFYVDAIVNAWYILVQYICQCMPCDMREMDDQISKWELDFDGFSDEN